MSTAEKPTRGGSSFSKTAWIDRMAKTSKKVVIGSMAVSGLVALAALVDMVSGFPFNRLYLLDSFFLISAGLVCYLGWETYQEMK